MEMTDDVLAVRYSPNGKFIAVALLDTTVKVGSGLTTLQRWALIWKTIYWCVFTTQDLPHRHSEVPFESVRPSPSCDLHGHLQRQHHYRHSLVRQEHQDLGFGLWWLSPFTQGSWRRCYERGFSIGYCIIILTSIYRIWILSFPQFSSLSCLFRLLLASGNSHLLFVLITNSHWSSLGYNGGSFTL